MGKTASASVYLSLKKTTDYDVFHVHRLNPENIKKVKDECLQRCEIPPNEELGLYLYKNLIRKRETSTKIITLVREPIARNISAYFQNMEFSEAEKNAQNDLEIEKLTSGFIQKYSHDVPLNWFDVELKKTTGIDIYKYDFPKQQGYQIIDSPPYHVLILRHDLDDRLKEKCITTFLDIDTFKLSRSNEASSKEYAEIYRKFISSVKLRDKYIKHMLSSRYAQHFFSTKEIRDISNKWSRN